VDNRDDPGKLALTIGAGKRPVVWVVDDVESVRKSLAAVLETATMAVRDFASADDFLAAFRPGAAACLILDHHMPDMTGLELLQQLHAGTGALPTIVVSGHGDDKLREHVMSAGAVSINKPVDVDELIGLIERVTLKES
jgi:FixJ family two-component response regulator